jgi:hypothetical protein
MGHMAKFSYRLIHGGAEHTTGSAPTTLTIEAIREAIVATDGSGESRGLYILVNNGEDDRTAGELIVEPDRVLSAAKHTRKPQPDPSTLVTGQGTRLIRF